MIYHTVVVPPPPPPPAPRLAEAPARAVNPNAAPIVAPNAIQKETGLELTTDLPVISDIGVIGITGDLDTAVVAPPPAAPPKPPATVRVGAGVRPPAKVRDVAPIYPSIAQLSRVEGTVIIEATIDTDGRVQAARVLRSQPLLDDAALTAVRQWEYTPTLLNGTPVPVVMTVTVTFALRR